MSYTVHVANSDIAFECATGMTILDAAKAAGYEIPYSCRNGVCGSCKGRILSGSAELPAGVEGVTAQEQAAGYTLFCQARPCSDLEIGVRDIARIDPNARKLVAAKVYRATRVGDDVTLLQLRFSAGTRVKFKAGQYLQIVLEDGSRRSFSMANPPQQSDGAQLHIRHLAGGKFSSYLESGPQAGDIVQVELPFGDFYLRESSDQPIVFVASGTGFAPIQSILEDTFRRKLFSRPMTLYWGARRRQDLYLADLPMKWAQQHPHFTFIPVLSEPDGTWTGRTGFVHHAVMQDFPSLAAHQVYACGVPVMINAARQDFVEQCALPSDAFFCDAFVTERGGN
jgi:NAD(P)H-flavin reductase/ferredoxin